MDVFTEQDLRALLEEREPPLVSLFLPTPRGSAEEARLRFRHLLAQVEERLRCWGLRAAEVHQWLRPLRSLETDTFFWSQQADGLALFYARDFLRFYRLPQAFREEMHLGGLFLVTPLLPLLHGDGRFYLLALSQNHVRLFQGTRFTFRPVALEYAPHSLAEALQHHDADEVLTFHTRPTSGGSWGAIFEGHGVGIDDEKKDLLRYFQRIDRGLHPLLREEQAPLVLASVAYLRALYRQANTYPHLLEEGLDGNPDRLRDQELHDRAWAVVSSYFQTPLRQALARYHQAAARGYASAEVHQVVPAAYRGEVEVLFVAQDRHLWGILGPGADDLCLHPQPEPADEEILNLAARQTLRHGWAVYVLRPEEMPAGEFLAAIYHLPQAKHGKRPG
jgi:hypothetical protein